MRHVSRTHRVALDWLFDRINVKPKIQIKYVDTKKRTRWHADQREFHAWRVEPYSSFSQHHEFPDVQHHVEESSGKKDRRRACGGETEVGMFGVKKPTGRKANIFFRLVRFTRPGDSRVRPGFCFRDHRETFTRQVPEPSDEFSRVAKRWHSVSGEHKEICAEWCVWAFREYRETCARCRKPTCKNKVGLPQRANLRLSIRWQKSSRTFDRSWVFWKTNVSIWGLFMSTTMKHQFVLGQVKRKFWLRAGTPTSKSSGRCTQRLILEHEFEILNVSRIEWHFTPWMRSTLPHDKVIKWAKAKVHVYSDAILFVCLKSWISRCFFFAAITVIFFLARSGSREPCQREGKKRLPVKTHRWRNQSQWIRRWRSRNPWISCCTTRWVRGTFRKIWAIQSIWGMSMVNEAVVLAPGNRCRPSQAKIQSNILKWSDQHLQKKFWITASIQHFRLKHWRRMYWYGECSCFRQWVQPSILDNFSWQNWKCTRTRTSRKFQGLFITQKLILEHSEKILNVNTIEGASRSCTTSTLSHDQLLQDKSKSTWELRLRTVSVEDVGSINAITWFGRSSGRIQNVRFLKRIAGNWSRGFSVKVLSFRVQGLGFGVWGSGFTPLY